MRGIVVLLVGVAFCQDNAAFWDKIFPPLPPPTGSWDYTYSYQVSADTAEYFKNFTVQYNIEWEKTIAKLSENKSAGNVLSEYKEIIVSAAGKTCVKDKSNDLTSKENAVSTIVNDCIKSIPMDKVEQLKDETTNILKQIQTIDQTMEHGTKICFAIKLPTSIPCRQKKLDSGKQQLEEVKCVSNQTRFFYLLRQATFNTVNVLKECVTKNTSIVMGDIQDSIAEIKACLT